jgi:deoxyuridine 5'-triphosphate nucleotidohydrolase
MNLKFKRLPHGEGLPLPTYATSGAAAMDICAANDYIVGPNATMMIQTGFAVAVPEGHELQCRPRSGLAAKHGISITNSPGTIDSDYRGEICVLLHNTKQPAFSAFGGGPAFGEGFIVSKGDRIAQLVLAPVVQAIVEEVDELDETDRGTGGFGSTGRN